MGVINRGKNMFIIENDNGIKGKSEVLFIIVLRNSTLTDILASSCKANGLPSLCMAGGRR